MKKSVFYTVVLIFISFSLLGQIRKGDWMFDSDNFIKTGRESSILSWYTSGFLLSETAGLMLSDRMMLGLAIQFSQLNFQYPGGLDDSKVYWQTTGPFFRYYIKNSKKNLLFGEFSTRFRVQWGSFGATDTKSYTANIMNIGLGLNHKFAQNIALDMIMGAKINEWGDALFDGSNEEVLYLNIGLKTFLTPNEKVNENIEDRYLHKGNAIIEGRGSFHTVYYDNLSLNSYSPSNRFYTPTGLKVSLSPRFEYFKTDFWTVSAGVDMKLLAIENGYHIGLGGSIGSSLYIPLWNQFYFRPSLGLAYKRTVANADFFSPPLIAGGMPVLIKNKESIQEINFPSSILFSHFTNKNFIFSAGVETQIYYSESKTLGDDHFVEAKIVAKVDYFLAANLSFNATFKRSIYLKNGHRPSLDVLYRDLLSAQARLSFGLSYFIFKKG